MNQKYIILILFFCYKTAISQKDIFLNFNDSIIDFIRIELSSSEKALKSNQQKCYIHISELCEFEIQLNISHYYYKDKRDLITKLVKKSNVYILIDNLKIPVLTEPILSYNSSMRYTDKNGYLIQESKPRSGYFIRFKKYGKETIVQKGYEQ